MRRVLLAVTMAMLGLSTVAQAQLRPVLKDSDVQADDEDRREITIAPAHVKGELIGPHESWMKAPPRSGFASMILLRANFTPELKKSIDQL